MLRAFAGSWLLFTGVAMVGLLVSAASSLRGRAIGITVGIVVAWFFLNFIALLIDGISGPRYASPFHYFRPTDLLAGRTPGGDLLMLAAVPVLAALAEFAWSPRMSALHHPWFRRHPATALVVPEPCTAWCCC